MNFISIFKLSSEETKDEPFAWEAREFLRKKLIGEEVWFTAEKPPNATREYGTVFLGKGTVAAIGILSSVSLDCFEFNIFYLIRF